MYYLGQETARIYHGGVEIGKAYRNGSLVFDNSLHAITQAVLSYATGQGYTLPSDLGAYDAHIRGVEVVLAKLDLYYILCGDGGTGFKLINVVKPGTYNGTGLGGLTWLSGGVQGNGTNAYVNTNFNPSLLPAGQKYQLNDAVHGGVVYAVNGANWYDNIVDISGGASNANSLFSLSASGHKINQSGNSLPAAVDLGGTGLKIIQRKTSAGVELYNKGVMSTATIASTVIDNSTQRLLSTGSVNFGKGTIASYLMGAALTSTNVSTLRSATNTYLTALGLTAVA
ncbi:hypothetical protein [Niabella aurantiaca]|uniref:hypothetical protein n=1 Tax=Niabella aurantiaca TaxID=379900 RepID=UPI00037881DC|nr:hypothetical protein [Niabella aurantiaca]